MTMNDGIILTFILIGIIIIIVSFLLDKYQGHLIKLENEKIEQKSNRQIDYDEVVQKIIELNEYGEFLKADLDKRQKELVFIYQLLLDKQKEVNELISSKTVKAKSDQPDLQKAIKVPEPNLNHKLEVPISNQNFNKQIMDMTVEGYTSTEIAKALKIGKGQVELVQNLYR